MSYTPKHQRQLDGSALQGSDCGPTSLSVAIDRATRGAAVPTTEAIRKLARDHSGGTTPDDWKRACDAMGVRSHRPNSRAQLSSALSGREAVVIAVQYGRWRAAGLPAYGSFTGWHAMTILASGPDHLWLYDPLAPGKVRVSRRAVLTEVGSSPVAFAVRNPKG